MYCKKCGKEIGQATICPVCGTEQNQQQTPQPVVVNVVNNNNNVNKNTNTNVNGGIGYYKYKHKWLAFILCLFFGFLGIHRFYVGKNGTGILWLFTIGLGGVGWIIDLILILIGAFRDKAGFPLI